MRTIEELQTMLPVTDLRMKCFWDAVEEGNKRYNNSQRFFRAVNLLVEGKVKLLEDGKSAKVEASTDPKCSAYLVTPHGHCSCEDYIQWGRSAWFCKHSLATSIIRKARKLYSAALRDEKYKKVEAQKEDMYSCVG